MSAGTAEPHAPGSDRPRPHRRAGRRSPPRAPRARAGRSHPPSRPGRAPPAQPRRAARPHGRASRPAPAAAPRSGPHAGPAPGRRRLAGPRTGTAEPPLPWSPSTPVGGLRSGRCVVPTAGPMTQVRGVLTLSQGRHWGDDASSVPTSGRMPSAGRCGPAGQRVRPSEHVRAQGERHGRPRRHGIPRGARGGTPRDRRSRRTPGLDAAARDRRRRPGHRPPGPRQRPLDAHRAGVSGARRGQRRRRLRVAGLVRHQGGARARRPDVELQRGAAAGAVTVHDDPDWVLDVVTRLTERHEAGRDSPGPSTMPRRSTSVAGCGPSSASRSSSTRWRARPS